MVHSIQADEAARLNVWQNGRCYPRATQAFEGSGPQGVYASCWGDTVLCSIIIFGICFCVYCLSIFFVGLLCRCESIVVIWKKLIWCFAICSKAQCRKFISVFSCEHHIDLIFPGAASDTATYQNRTIHPQR